MKFNLSDTLGLGSIIPSEFSNIVDNVAESISGIIPSEFQTNNSNIFENSSDTTSYLGTPIFTNVTLTDGGSNTIQLDSVTVDVSQTIDIKETTVQGRTGKVKELISDSDFSVTIKGFLTSMDMYKYPKSDVKTLLLICKAPRSIKVTSDFLLQFGIHEVTIKAYTIDQTSKEGYNNVQPFTLTCVSNIPIELNIDDE